MARRTARADGLYLGGIRYGVKQLTMERYVGDIPRLAELRLYATVTSPKGSRLPQSTNTPTLVRYRGMSGYFFINADVNGKTIQIKAVSAGAFR